MCVCVHICIHTYILYIYIYIYIHKCIVYVVDVLAIANALVLNALNCTDVFAVVDQSDS